jgi:hypothetical protein
VISVEAARREFDGKELLVEGYVIKAVDGPKNDEGEGLILLGSEKKVNTRGAVLVHSIRSGRVWKYWSRRFDHRQGCI